MSEGSPLRRALAISLGIGVLSAAAWTQEPSETSPSPSNLSLGDLARQTRAQRSADQGISSKAQQLVDEMQQEQEAQDNAPVGFKNYDAGDYRLFVPFPYSLEGRENGGAVLLGSQLGVTNTEVMAGAPIPIPANAKDIDLMNLARQAASQHGANPYCSTITLGSHKAFRCNWSSTPNLLGHQVSGSVVFIVSSHSLIPVMCAAPNDQNLCLGYDQYSGFYPCNNRYAPFDQVQRIQAAMIRRDAAARTTWQVCDQIIYPSIQLKEDIVVHPATIPEGKLIRTALPVAQDTSVSASGSQEASLGELARKTRQSPHGTALATLDNADGKSLAPAGFQATILQFCQNPQHCAEATVVIPEKSETVSTVNGQRIFKTILNGDPVFLYAGPADVNDPYRSMTDRDYVRIRDLANPNGFSREKTDAVSTQELTIAGKPALMTRFRYQRDDKIWWIGERALIEMQHPYERPFQFMVGCTAPEQRFSDAEALCTTLVNSLRLP